MGGPYKNPTLAALQSRSRFCEGSMNDRASFAPPVQFLGPDALAALEQPVPLPCRGGDEQNPPRCRPSHDTGSGGGGFSQTWSRKTGSRLFGQVWEGVRGRLRLRRDDGDAKKMTTTTNTTPAAAISAATTTTAVTQTNAEHIIAIYTDPAERDGPPASRTRSRLAAETAAATPMNIPRPSSSSAATTAADFQFTGFQSARPSRDEVLASYQQLMAGGFFQAHAIQSSRHGLGRPTATVGTRPSTSHGPQHRSQPPPPPQWPLGTPRQEPVQSPKSVSSRGTKRAAAPDSDSDDESMPDADDADEQHAGVHDKENQAPAHPNTVHDDGNRQPKKRLRRLASGESLFVPKTRTVSSSSRRSLSSSIPPPPTNKLQKRRPQLQPRPRHVSDGGGSARVLRGRPAEEHRSMRVVPDEGRGIPSVPVIPARFTYGEDRESNGPWRGLRVR
ncbi:hypothetical protein A9K55_000612 [Cordyceps militaris]|uniref:Uncharacterized protein n=1 Tax=Cordyceps militaris TaxID=73501 RepID=A0A2H4SV46_CORMI|nr:hypothetical protein A9K55_000612 [Cordyceps militaris]